MKGKIEFKDKKIHPLSDNNTILRMLCFIFLIAIFSHTLSGQENCEECQNPIVELKNLEIGDFKTAADDIEEMSKEFYGWDDLLGKKGISAFDVLQRGFEFLSGINKRNPCADIYYNYEDFESEIIRFGANKGQAKYNIESTLNFSKKASGGEKALVRHVVYQVTELDVPLKRYFKLDDSHTIELTEYYDVKEISNKLKLIPKKGTVEIVNELLALKNDDVYDTGSFQMDWVSDPDQNEAYFSAIGETLTVDGQTYQGSEGGLICGNFSTGTIAGAPIIFDKGDIGLTIRKKETPSSCSADVDDISKFPPHYKLKVTDIKNQINETMPNNVKIALKAESGKILSGEEHNGWRIFNTINGQIPDGIIYDPPSCAEAKVDIVKVAGICDYHDGVPSVGKPRFDLKITNSRCYDAVATMTSIYTNKKKYYKSGDPGYIDFKEIKTYDREIKATITIGLELQTSIEMNLWNEYWEYYIEKSRDINSFSDKTHDYWYWYHETNSSTWYDESTGREEGKEEKFGYPLPTTIVLVYDLPKKEPQRVIIGGPFLKYNIYKEIEHRSWVNGILETEEESGVDISEGFEISPVEENSNASDSDSPSLKHKDFVIQSGGGKDSFRGEGKVEEIKRGNDCYDYDECSDTKIFRWHFRRFKQGK